MGNDQIADLKPAMPELRSKVTELRWEATLTTSTPTTIADDGAKMDIERGELENCKMRPRKIKMLLDDDTVYEILQWLPVISLLRFKLVCKAWRALIESSYFIKHHLHRHHCDPKMKDKNRSLICLLRDKDTPFTFALTSVEGFEEPKVCLQLNYSDLHGYLPTKVLSAEVVSYNGIMCLNIFDYKREQSICLWNPATKQSRVLPRSPVRGKALASIGFGFDVKNDDYKVVNVIPRGCSLEMIIQVYSLRTNSWRRVTTDCPFSEVIGNPRMPFNNGTCCCWLGYSQHILRMICFDFCSEMFRSISVPWANGLLHHTQLTSVIVCDKISCVFSTNDQQIEIWVFNEYGTVNESWTKQCTVDVCSIIGEPLTIYKRVSMNGNYIFYKIKGQMGRFNVVTKETNCFALENMHPSIHRFMVEFKESMVSVEEGKKCNYLH